MKRKNITAIFVLIGILSSLVLSFSRISTESDNKSVDFILNYDEINKLSEQSDEDLEWWLKGFKNLGASTVSLLEESFDSLVEDEKPLDVEIVANIKQDIHWKDKYSEELVDYLEQEKIDRYDVVSVTDSKELFEFIKRGLNERYDSKNYKVIESEGQYAFVLDGTIEESLYATEKIIMDTKQKRFSKKNELVGSKITNLGIGYDQAKIDIIKKSGLNIILRPLNSVKSWSGEKYIKTSLNQYKELDINPKYMVFTGGEILGYPDNIKLVEKFIKDNNVKVGLIESPVQREHIEQKGLEDLTRNIDYQAIRIFSIPGFIQERYQFYNYEGAEEIENTLYRAVTERNIRAIYFNPFKLDKNVYVTDYDEYEKTFKSFEDRIAKHNMTIGEASVMKSNHVNNILKIFVGIGILGGAVLLLEEIVKIKRKFLNVVIALGILGIIASTIVVPNLSNTIFAIGAAIVFPSLSMVYFCKRLKTYYEQGNDKNEIKNTIIFGIKELVIMTLISFIGSLFVATLLSDIEYLLEMRIFRGVKIVQIIPLFVYIISFIGHFGYQKEKKISDNKIKLLEIKEILKGTIKIGYAVLAGIVFFVGYIYLARTGHETDVQPSDLEMIGRNLLELKLIARPRIKEFLLAFPAVLIALDLAFNKSKAGIFIVGLLIALGQTSVVNTFSHLRTPMYLSAMRLGYGIVFGIVIGIIYMFIIKVVIKILGFLRGELFDE